MYINHDEPHHSKNTTATVGWLEFNVPFQHKYGYIRNNDSLH